MTASVACLCGTCPSCTGTSPPRPVGDPIAYRHGAVRQRLLDSIGSIEIDGARPLAELGTRDTDDPAIALIDAFAGSVHILAWNAGRLYEDGTLRGSEDRDALVDLTRLLGYEPRPALSATTTLSFELEDLDTSPKVATIPKGTKVASVPLQDETPQTFETDSEILARAEWNALLPVLDQVAMEQSTTALVIAGGSSPAKAGDVVLYKPAGLDWRRGRILKVSALPADQPSGTRIEVATGLETLDALTALAAVSSDSVLIFGTRAAAFGANAPDPGLFTTDHKTALGTLLTTDDSEWANLKMPGTTTVDLDAVYPEAMPGRIMLFQRFDDPKPSLVGLIATSAEGSRADFGLSAKVTRVTLTDVNLDTNNIDDSVRETGIHIETARETLLFIDEDEAVPPAATDRLLVQGLVELPIGRRVVLSGEEWQGAAGVEGPVTGEVATILATEPSGDNTELQFERTISTTFRSTTLVVLGNSVSASHGETPSPPEEEVIGSGNAATRSPRFELKRAPLTYVPATNARGYAPAIEVRVNDRLYAEQTSLFGLDTQDHGYTVKNSRTGKPEVQFAGILPTGSNNVEAVYRSGAGAAANLDRARLTTAMAPIVGVRSVSNPVPAEGGSDEEALEDIRTLAPQSIGTLDRVVSLADYEAFARSYRGIGKALATELHIGMRSIVCLTVANTALESPAPGSDTFETLRDALALVAPPGRTVRIEGFTRYVPEITLGLAVDEAFRREDVESAVRTALSDAFGPEARPFARALHASEVIAVAQGVEGVIAVTITSFELPGGEPESEGRLLSPAPAIVGGIFRPAGLVAIDGEQILFEEMLP